MWTLKTKQRERVTIIFHADRITIAWIHYHKTSKQLRLNAYKSILFLNHEIKDGIIYNPTKLKNILYDFLILYNLANAQVSLAIDAPLLAETYCKTTIDRVHHYDADKFFKSKVWDERYVGPAIDNDGFMFYACGLMQEHIFHYQLFAIFANLDLRLVTSTTMTHFALYKYIHGPAFRQTQLSTDLAQNAYNISNFFTTDTITRSLRIHPGIDISIEQEYKTITHALGLFVAEMEYLWK